MALKKNSKISPNFNMSSLTDIIFLLLIFFMLTSSLVTPNALNLKLPGKSKTTITTDKKPAEIEIDSRGKYRYDGSRTTIGKIATRLKSLSRKAKPIVTISPDRNAPVESVIAVMDLAMTYHIETIMAVED